MVKVTLSVLCLGAMILGTAASNDPDHSDLECAVDGSKAFNDAADAAIFIWAATQRCDFAKQPAPVAPVVTAAPAPVTTAAPATTAVPVATTGVPTNAPTDPPTTAAPRKLGPTTPPNAVRCTIDISSAVSAVGGMINIIVGALDKCDIIHSDGEGCGEAAGKLTAAAAGLVAGASGVINSCPNAFQPSTKEKIPAHLEKTTHLGKCVIDAKGSLAGTFDAMQSLKKIGSGRRRRKTLHNALNTVSAFSSLGSAVAAAVNDCSAYENHLGNHQADCSSYILALVSQLNNIADIASDMADECKVSASRLYLEDAEDEKKYTNTVTSNSMSLALAAFLPVTAVFGFILGRRFSNSRSHRDFDSALQVELE